MNWEEGGVKKDEGKLDCLSVLTAERGERQEVE